MKLRCALLACFLALPPQVASTAQAQILNLDTAPKGPTLPKDCATTALAAALTKEAEQLEQAMLQQTGHERLASEAGACLRRTGAFLLGVDAPRDWNESVAVFAGLRLARARASIDAALDAYANERRSAVAAASRPLSREDLTQVDALLTRYSSSSLEILRRASLADTNAVADAAMRATSPLAEALVILEGRDLPDCWPAFALSSSTAPAQASRDVVRRSLDAASVQERVTRAENLDPKFREACDAALSVDAQLPLAQRSARVDALLTLAIAVNNLPLLEVHARDSMHAQLCSACAALSAREESSLQAIEGSARSVGALYARINALSDAAKSDEKLQDALRELAGAFAAAQIDSRGSVGESRRIAADRCSEALDCALAARKHDENTIARELREIARQLQRDYRAAELLIVRALVQTASGGSSFADPETVSALERMRSLAEDQGHLALLSDTVARITALKPSLSADMERRARLIARLLTDKLKRPDAIRALEALRDQTQRYAPFALEEPLRRNDLSLAQLTAVSCEALAQIGAERRVAWASAWAIGDTGSDAFVRMDRFVRLMHATEGISSRAESPMSRRAADALSMWGNWCASRTAFVPATTDASALLRLACASLLAGDEARFDSDLKRLEVAAPLVLLVASLETRLSSALMQSSSLATSEIAPLAILPANDAWLATERAQFAALCWSLAEMEGARTRGAGALEQSLHAFAGAIAKQLDQIVTPRNGLLGQIPSIDAEIAVAATRQRAKPKAPAAPPANAPSATPTSSTPTAVPTPAKPATKPAPNAAKPIEPKPAIGPANGDDAAPTGDRVPVVPRLNPQERLPRLPRQGDPTTQPNAEPKKEAASR
ncbi:MAG: hypothetical protein DWI11_10450 [Planctomycetota bacterium]|nr:MAG: hypothetical protein DWI11_10450 [Planctomycetota bacterium]